MILRASLHLHGGERVRGSGENPLTHLIAVKELEESQEGYGLYIRQDNLVLLFLLCSSSLNL